MHDPDRFRLLHGPYKRPRLKRGRIIWCERRGEVTVTGLTDAPIPWPTGRNGRTTTIILCGDLVRAVRQESNQAVAHWWGVSGQTVTLWRKALGVDPTTEGTSDLRRRHFAPRVAEMHELAAPTLGSPERRAKIAEAKRGKPRPPHVRKLLRRDGTTASAETRAKMSRSHSTRGTQPPAAGPPWPPEHDALFATYTIAEVAAITGRTTNAVRLRRRILGYPDARRKGGSGPAMRSKK